MKTMMNNDPHVMEDMFYAKQFAFSYSSLKKLLTSPMLFYKYYILGQDDEEETQSMVEGSLIHCLLFEPDMYDFEFIMSQDDLPSENVQDVITHVYELYMSEMTDETIQVKRIELKHYEKEILDKLAEMNLFQKMTEPVRLGKIINETGEKFWMFMKNATGKTIITPDIYSKCCDIVELIKKHPVAKLMGINSELQDNVFDETILETDIEGMPFSLKGKIDNFVIDDATSTVYVNDLKTIRSSLVDFPESVEKYGYWLQAAIYMRLTKKAVPLISKKAENYKHVFNFVVVDRYSQIYAFEVSEDTMTNWEIDLQEKLHEAKYHYESKDYSLPYKFVKSKVML